MLGRGHFDIFLKKLKLKTRNSNFWFWNTSNSKEGLYRNYSDFIRKC